ncbi:MULTISPECIES: ABC transporter permease [Pelosinus]|uniref:ABC-type transporter, integral membrane subunit n=1 Tax=Pelosinus fermentans B4 TaxID=1149862 RepID=I9LAC1_9FIRM|nr:MULTISPECIES: ABC transporter permease [Pelosinus]EIW17339.1 ABC-type transporter, integral membrane subunit [Pelosinus fermentans B4]EIW23398.1 ABC-type transporter, integral membrane subunit [Pelosinus fermentans A11]OAM96509.1 ABC-type transporter, integral membrane subunit [Pelosinus fermentans DSM 17108]SDR40886.1 oligopeptide transport system permease protein [Pelosinus fermentans]
MNLTSHSFEPILQKDAAANHIRPSMTYRQDAWRRLKKNKLAMFGLYAILLILLIALAGPWLSSLSYSDQDLMATNQSPSAEHWFGTDNLGRDLFIRVLYGARISLSIGIVASILNLTIGVIYGGIAGFLGGRIDKVMMNIVDILYGIPVLLYVILLMVVLEPGLINIFIALGIAYWLRMARIVRGQILSLKEQDYVLAARTLGAGSWRILFHHLLPNSMGPIIITMTLAIPEAIFTEAFLSFIGLGVAAPMASWGVLASEGITSLRSYPFQLFFPAMAISITMLAFNFLGDGLRDALDPRVRR